MGMIPDIIADVRLYSTDEGGRQDRTPQDFFCCPLVIPNSDLHDARIILAKHGSFAPGDSKRVPVKFLAPDQALTKFGVVSVLKIWEFKVIGEAIVVKISFSIVERGDMHEIR